MKINWSIAAKSAIATISGFCMFVMIFYRMNNNLAGSCKIISCENSKIYGRVQYHVEFTREDIVFSSDVIVKGSCLYVADEKLNCLADIWDHIVYFVYEEEIKLIPFIFTVLLPVLSIILFIVLLYLSRHDALSKNTNGYAS